VTERSLQDKVILITGSSRGIGAEVAVKAAREGAIVAVHYRSDARAAQGTIERVRQANPPTPVAGGDRDEWPGSEAFAADLADGAQASALVDRVVERFGRIDGLVNNAGRTLVGPFLDIEPADWDDVIRTDLTAAFHTSQAALPSMVERGSGAIVNVASRLGQMGVTETAAYSAAKAGLIGLTRALAREFGPHGIRINAVAPGVTVTEMTTDLVDSDAGKARLRDSAIGRFGAADEVAEAVIFLLSDRASLFTGQTLNPNGGSYMP
jgi:NAD(P)-dependent dehydrogenase (short-subunit alcohol dehydrogenase family)